MSEGVNRVFLIGNLGADVELRHAGDSAVCDLRLAISETYFDRDKVKRERVEWQTVVVWGPSAEACAKYLGKGSKVCVEGKLQTETWEKDGQKHSKVKIRAERVIFLESKGRSDRDENHDAEPPREQRREEPRGGQRSSGRDDRRGPPRGAPPAQGRGAASDYGV